MHIHLGIRRSLLAAAALTLFAHPASGQISASDTACSYERCALRLEAIPGAPFTSRLVQGIEGKTVASFGLRVPTIPVLERSADSVRIPYGLFRSRARRGSALMEVGLAATLESAIAFSLHPPASFRSVAPLLAADVGVGVAGLIEDARALRALQTSINRYNSALPSR